MRTFALRQPRPSIRLRLTATYGLVFLLTGALLLSIGYALVRGNITLRGGRPSPAVRTLIFPRPPPEFVPQGIDQDRVRRIFEAARRQVQDDALHRLLVEYIAALAAMTLVAVGTGWLLAGRALRPLQHITATAQRVSEENLGERIALTGPDDELRELADTFDGMLARLDAAFASQRRFVASASHELRTPLAIMRTEVDVALADPRASRAELRAMGDAVRETVDRCDSLIDSLLTLVRSEAAIRRDDLVDLGELVESALPHARAQASAAGLELREQIAPAVVTGERQLLERVVANLLDNAVRHNQPGGWLEVSSGTRDGIARLRVANGGPIIDPAEIEALVEPFHRLAGRTGPGFGLGLSIVSSVAHGHDGRLSLAAAPEGGLVADVELPPAPAARPARPELTKT